MFLSLSVQVLYLIPVKKSRRKKSAKKRVEKTKSCEKKVEDQFVYECTSVEVFIELHTRLLSLLWCKILLRFDCNTCILSILLVCIKSEFSLHVYLIHLHQSYIVVSTGHWSSSLDYDLALQYLEFRLHSLCIFPTKLHIKATIIGTLILYCLTINFLLPPRIALQQSTGIHKSFSW